MKYRIIYIILIIASQVSAQTGIRSDTIKISEVIIRGQQVSSHFTGFKTVEIEKEGIEEYASSTLGEMSSAFAPLFIKDYGSGGISTPSFRGTGASHTIILWNGININHRMVGQSDLSLITPGLTDKVIISPGSSSMNSGNGGFGGAIDLESNPVWGSSLKLSVCPVIGSFGHYSLSADVSYGTNTLMTVTKAFTKQAENNFEYLDKWSGNEPSLQVRKNGQSDMKGFLQELYFRSSGSTISARLWYQTSLRNLQMPVITQQVISGEKQKDESLRSMIDYSFRKNVTEYFAASAWLMDRLDYTNTPALIYSRNLANTLILKGGMSGNLGIKTKYRVELANEISFVNSNNYENKAARNNLSLTVSAERKTGERFGASVLVRQIIDKKSVLVPDFSAGIEFRLVPWNEYVVYSNISKNSRIPTLNELYWSPGGNTDLKNENAYSCELGYRMKAGNKSGLMVNTDISAFSSLIRNMIQWHPGAYSYWTADNLKSVNATGAEIFAGVKYSNGRFDVSLNTGYTFTRSVDSKNENADLRTRQLIYIPENQANGVIRIGFGNFHSSLITNFTGARYITADNTGFLPGYTISHWINGYKIVFDALSADINIRIENVFNVRYESIAYYPQPGRSFFLSIKFQYNK